MFTKSMVYYSSWSSTRQIFDFWDCFSGQVGNIALCLENTSQKWATFVFGSTNFHQNFTECMSNLCTHHFDILVYARCNYKLWNAFWFYYVLWAFSYIIIDHSCLNCCISTKLSLIVYLINTDLLKCQMWLQVMKCLLNLLRFFANLAQNWRIFISEVLQIHQTFVDCLSNKYIYFDMLICNCMLWKCI